MVGQRTPHQRLPLSAGFAFEQSIGAMLYATEDVREGITARESRCRSSRGEREEPQPKGAALRRSCSSTTGTASSSTPWRRGADGRPRARRTERTVAKRPASPTRAEHERRAEPSRSAQPRVTTYEQLER